MLSNMLKAKLHMGSVTQAELWYDGSCAIDSDLLKLAGMREFEQIDIYNVDNGERFTTYIIQAEAGSGTISMNGAAARRVQVGDRIIIATYCAGTNACCWRESEKYSRNSFEQSTYRNTAYWRPRFSDNASAL